MRWALIGGVAVIVATATTISILLYSPRDSTAAGERRNTPVYACEEIVRRDMTPYVVCVLVRTQQAIRVRIGDPLPDGGMLTAIEADAILVKDKRGVHRITVPPRMERYPDRPQRPGDVI